MEGLDLTGDILGQTDWEGMGSKLERMLGNKEVSFEQLTETLIRGDFKTIGEVGNRGIQASLSGIWPDLKTLISSLVLLVFISAFINVIKKTFQNKQIAEIANYSNYLIMIMLFIDLFKEMTGICEVTLNNIEQFMRIFFPTYFLMVGTTAGITGGLFYFQMAGLVIYFVEGILLRIVLPTLNLYMFLNFLNGIWEEDRLSGITSLMKKGITLSFKIMLAAVTGIGFMQSMILPITNGIQKEGIYHLLDLIPGVGDAAKGTFKIWLGSAVVVKNSVGIVGCIFLLLLVMTPLFRILLVHFVLKLVAALLSIVSEKKMIDCIQQVGNGIHLCFQTAGYGVLFFIILIAMSAYSSTGGF
ncbi:MAG: stage III sporulation protein AE [Lachnospiraceae bacterium]|nr:stage III sporulation protein AE [Lachnospiraceae bacterium]